MCLDFSTYLSMKILSSLKPLFASLCALEIDSFKSFSLLTILMPFPPPPAAALIRRGYPIFFASLGFDVIGRVGTSALIARSFAFNLSPITEITFAEGPIQIIFSFLTFLAKEAFSDRNPYPGWIACAPVFFAASII